MSYVISYKQTENGVQYYATPSDAPGENQLIGFEFGSASDAEAISMSLNAQKVSPESAYNLVPGLAQDRKAPILTPTEADARTAKNRDIAGSPTTPNGMTGRAPTSLIAESRSTPGSSDYMDQAQYTGLQTRKRDPSLFGDTPGRKAEMEWLAQKGFPTGTSLGPDTGSGVGVTPTDWGLFEQDLMAGQVDPRRAVDEQLSRQGLPTHANRGFLEDTYANYGTLRQMQSPGLTPEPVDMFNEATGFTNDLFGMTGNSMNRVDTQGLWDNQFSQDYMDTQGAEYSAVSANGDGAGEQHQYEFEDINQNIAALAPHIGEGNAGYLMTLTQKAYDEYLNDPARNQMTFAQYLRDVKGAGDWY